MFSYVFHEPHYLSSIAFYSLLSVGLAVPVSVHIGVFLLKETWHLMAMKSLFNV